MYATFNMGIGFVLIAGKNSEGGIIDALSKSGETAFTIGHIKKSEAHQKVTVSY
jgi:phosphoribosylformylglycinamidine cyclo-ligase